MDNSCSSSFIMLDYHHLSCLRLLNKIKNFFTKNVKNVHQIYQNILNLEINLFKIVNLFGIILFKYLFKYYSKDEMCDKYVKCR